ncbi:MAG: hypothetical protein V7609_2740 [Verrucomicrobiota bacterium]
MVNTTTKYIVYSHSGGGVRHHHFGTENNIIGEAHGRASRRDILLVPGFRSLRFNGQDVQFAFMSVHGAKDGNHLYTVDGNREVEVGDDDVDILVVYAPPGGIGGGQGGPAVWVDAFNVDTGQFSDSLDFVTVLRPPTPPDTVDVAKTSLANSDGSVSTVTAENIRANDRVDEAPFVEWKKITPSELILSPRQIDLARNQSGEIWFAFYQTPPPPNISIPSVERELAAGIMIWSGDETCGNGGHWIFGPHGPGPVPFKLRLSKEILGKLNLAQAKQMQAYMDDYPAAAKAGLAGMTKVLKILNGASQILSEIK